MSPDQRMTNAELLAAVSAHLVRIDAIGREMGISGERMGWGAASWPLRCVRAELDARAREDIEEALKRSRAAGNLLDINAPS